MSIADKTREVAKLIIIRPRVHLIITPFEFIDQTILKLCNHPSEKDRRLTGLRIGELVNLRWIDVDLEKRVLHVRVQEEWKPKGRRDRVVPMHPRVESAIRSRPVGVYVFVGPNGGRIKETYTRLNA